MFLQAMSFNQNQNYQNSSNPQALTTSSHWGSKDPIGEAKTPHHTSHPSSIRRSLGACSAHVCERAKAHHQADHCYYYKTQHHTAHPAAYGVHWVPTVHRRVMSRRTPHKHGTAYGPYAYCSLDKGVAITGGGGGAHLPVFLPRHKKAHQITALRVGCNRQALHGRTALPRHCIHKGITPGVTQTGFGGWAQTL